jgi:hypothetical protein
MIQGMPWKRILAVWLVLIAAESASGTLRLLYLAPQLGEPEAGQVGVFVGLGLILAISLATSGWIGPRERLAWMRVGLVWAALTLAFDYLLGRALGYSTARILADYDPGQGGLMALGLIGMVYCPRIAARLRGTLT